MVVQRRLVRRLRLQWAPFNVHAALVKTHEGLGVIRHVVLQDGLLVVVAIPSPCSGRRRVTGGEWVLGLHVESIVWLSSVVGKPVVVVCCLEVFLSNREHRGRWRKSMLLGMVQLELFRVLLLKRRRLVTATRRRRRGWSSNAAAVQVVLGAGCGDGTWWKETA